MLWEIIDDKLQFKGTIRDPHTCQLVDVLIKTSQRSTNNSRSLELLCRHSYDRLIVYEFCELFELTYQKLGSESRRTKHGYMCNCCNNWITFDNYLTYTRFNIKISSSPLWKHSSIRKTLEYILPSEIITKHIYSYLTDIHQILISKIKYIKPQ